jgi:hypothetical protein
MLPNKICSVRLAVRHRQLRQDVEGWGIAKGFSPSRSTIAVVTGNKYATRLVDFSAFDTIGRINVRFAWGGVGESCMVMGEP